MKRVVIILTVLAFCGHTSAEGGLWSAFKSVGTFIFKLGAVGNSYGVNYSLSIPVCQ